ESAPIPFVTLDRNSFIRDINLNGSNFLGWRRSALVGKPLFKFVASTDRQIFLDHLRHAIQHGKSTSQVSLTAKDGSIRRTSFSTFLVHGKKGTAPLECRTAILDLTEFAHAETERR